MNQPRPTTTDSTEEKHEASTPDQAGAIGGTLRTRLLLVVLSLLGATTILISTSRYGAGISPDSVAYVSVARSLVEGRGFVDYHGALLALWPPLYPALLAVISLISRLDPLTCAPVVNAVLFAALIGLSGLLFAQYVTRSSALVLLGAASVLVSRTLFNSSVSAMSEPLFICCVLLLLLSARRYGRDANMASLMVMSFSAAAAPLIRYVGLIVIPVGAVMVLSRGRTRPKTRLLHLAGFLCISTAPLVAWVMWGYLRTGGPPPLSSDLTYSRSDSFGLVVSTVLGWFAQGSAGRLALIRNASFVALASGLAVAGLARLSHKSASGLWLKTKGLLLDVGPLLLFLVLYTLFAAVSHAALGSALDDRLLSPVFVPTFVLLFALLDRSIGILRAGPRRIVRIGLPATVCIWLLVPAFEVGCDALTLSRRGAGGFSTVEWKESPTINFVEHLAPSARAVLYSNAPDALYILRNLEARWSPRKPPHVLERTIRLRVRYAEPPPERLKKLEGVWPEQDGGLLVWFSGVPWRYYLFTPSELGLIAHVDTLAKLDDGTIYMVSRR